MGRKRKEERKVKRAREREKTRRSRVCQREARGQEGVGPEWRAATSHQSPITGNIARQPARLALITMPCFN